MFATSVGAITFCPTLNLENWCVLIVAMLWWIQSLIRGGNGGLLTKNSVNNVVELVPQ